MYSNWKPSGGFGGNTRPNVFGRGMQPPMNGGRGFEGRPQMGAPAGSPYRGLARDPYANNGPTNYPGIERPMPPMTGGPLPPFNPGQPQGMRPTGGGIGQPIQNMPGNQNPGMYGMSQGQFPRFNWRGLLGG